MLLADEIITQVATEKSVDLLQSAQKFALIREAVDHLINTDFSRLVQVLYQVDVSETALKKILQEQPGNDAADLITRLLIERQIEKIKSRVRFSADDSEIPENEHW